MLDRRNFLKGASLLAMGALAACNAKPEGAAAAEGEAEQANPTDKNIGLQIYTLGPELYQGDLAANFQKIAGMGIKNLELAGYDPADSKIGGVEMMEFKSKAEAAGLTIVSSHVNPPALFAGVAGREDRSGKAGQFSADMKTAIVESFKKIADDHAKLGCKYLVQPMMAMSGINNEDDCKAFADILNATGEVVKAAGLQFGYHNHNMEFAKVTKDSKEAILGTVLHPAPGQQILDIFMDNTDAANVMFEMDIYWTVMGQNDPVEWLTKRADRIQLLHIKDRMVLGESGMLNYKNIFDKFFANGRQYYFIEMEDTNSGKQMDRLAGCAKFLMDSPFVK